MGGRLLPPGPSGRECQSLAYPCGAVDRQVVAAAGQAGYRHAVTLPRGLHRPEPLHWPRVGIYHVDGEARWRAEEGVGSTTEGAPGTRRRAFAAP